MKLLPLPLLYLLVKCQPVWNAEQHNQKHHNLIPVYANVSAAIATYFSSACIYLLTHSEEQDKMFLYRTAKYISLVFGRPNTVASFSDYYQMLITTSPLDRCYVPLQVLVDRSQDDNLRNAFVEHSHKTSMHGTDQYGGGVWLLFLDSFNETFIDKYFQGVHLPFDVELIVAWIDEQMVHLKEVYRVVPAFPIRQPYLANWTSETGLHAPRDPLHYSRRTDLEGFEMVVGYVDGPPITIPEKQGDTLTYLGGYFGDIWQVLADAMNATSVYKEVAEFGEYLPSENWTGLLGEIKHNKVDIGVADFVLTRSRFEIMDFSFPLIVTTYQIFFQHPGSSLEINALFLPLGFDVWLVLLVWLALGALVLYGGCKMSDIHMGTDEKYTMIKSFFFIFGALCSQAASSEEIPTKLSCKLLFFLTHLITAVLIPSYSASLISYLTVMPNIIPFTNMQEFYQSNYKMTVRKGTYEYDIFSYGSVTDPFIKRIFDRDLKDNGKLPRDYKQAINNLCGDKYQAFFGVQDTMQWTLDIAQHVERTMKGCVVTTMPHNAGQVTIGMAMPKKSHFKGLVNHHIRNFQAIGIMERLRKKHWVMYDKSMGEVWTPVNILATMMMFLILGTGIGLGFLIYSVEKALWRFISSRKDKKHYDNNIVSVKPLFQFGEKNHFNHKFPPFQGFH